MTYLQSPNLITRTILKKAIDVTNEKYEKNQLYKSKEDLIVLIQALARGFLVRKAVKQRIDYFVSNLDQIAKIQVSLEINEFFFLELLLKFDRTIKVLVAHDSTKNRFQKSPQIHSKQCGLCHNHPIVCQNVAYAQKIPRTQKVFRKQCKLFNF